MEEEHQSHDSEEKESFRIKKIRVWQGATFLFALLFVGSLFTNGFGFDLGGSDGESGTDERVQAPDAPRPTPPPSPAAGAEVEVGNSPVKGDKDAPVTLIEFSDFQCPFCSRFYTQTLSQIEEEYVDTGKVKFVYKHFPLDSIHPQATPAALASECAKEQGKFWEYHDKLFENQRSLGDSNYKQWAADLNLDTGQFDECYDSAKYDSKLRSDLQEGSAAGIRGTPGFLLNGQVISGAQPFANFQRIIDAELAKQ